MNDHENFFAILPLELVMCGWQIRLSSRSAGSVRVEVLNEVDTRPSSQPTDISRVVPVAKFFHRGILETVQLVFDNNITGTPEELKAFFKSYLISPIGVRVLTFGSRDDISKRRLHVLRCAFETWRQISAARTKDGHLRAAVRCNAYTIECSFKNYDVANHCSNRTKNSSGLCHLHQHAVTTIWNYEPFSRIEAYWDQTVIEVEEIVQSKREEAERQKAEAAQRLIELEKEREQRKTKWQHVAATFPFTATERQIYYLLDLGARPEQLRGITNAEASDLIKRMIGKVRKVR